MSFCQFDEGMENYGKKMESGLDVLLKKPLASEWKSPELVENGIWSRLLVSLMREWKTVELVENGFEN